MARPTKLAETRVSAVGLVVPREILDFTITDHSSDTAHAAKMNRAAQTSLLSQGAPGLELCPFAFKLVYKCAAEHCGSHAQTIVDWEISEAWRKWRHSYPNDYLQRIEEKWLGLVAPQRRPALFVGNQHQAPQGFLTLGIARDVEPIALTPATSGESDAGDVTRSETPEAPRLFDL